MLNVFPSAANFQNHQAFPILGQKRKRPLVMVVKSDDDKRRSLTSLLELYQIDILPVDNGAEAIDLAVFYNPELVIMNTDLAGLDGFETARLFRTIKAFDQ